MNLQLLLLQLALALGSVAKSYSKDKDAVLLSNVRSLTLQSGKQTTARRVTAIPQLTCVGGNAKKHYEVDVMRCENSGSEYDAEDIQWTCKANLPPEFKLGSTEVVCEGYDNSDDPYVLKGSCGVEYRLILTDLGEEKYGLGGWFNSRPKYEKQDPIKDSVKQSSKESGSGSSEQSFGNLLFTIIFWVLFIGIVLLILYSFVRPEDQNIQPRAPRNPPRGGGVFWGGGGDDDNDPPPPYTPRAPPRPKTQPSAPRTPRSNPTPRQSNPSSSSRSANSGPGFWSGTAAGAAGGYAAGNYMANRAHRQEQERQEECAREQERQRRHELDLERERQREQQRQRDHERQQEEARRQESVRQQSLFGPGPSSYGQGGSSWFGGGGATGSSAGPSTAPSTGRYESTGFGGTRRR